MTIDDMTSVLQAAKEGKRIEHKLKNEVGDFWCDAFSPIWDFHHFDYRVKPEPREWWVNLYPKEKGGYAHARKEDADHWQSGKGHRQQCVHVREVLE